MTVMPGKFGEQLAGLVDRDRLARSRPGCSRCGSCSPARGRRSGRPGSNRRRGSCGSRRPSSSLRRCSPCLRAADLRNAVEGDRVRERLVGVVLAVEMGPVPSTRSPSPAQPGAAGRLIGADDHALDDRPHRAAASGPRTICVVEQLGLAMIPLALRAASGLTSGMTSGDARASSASSPIRR